MKAVCDGAVIAQAPEEDLVRIEGNWYFPPASITEGALAESPTQYHCPWKGDAQYFHVNADGKTHDDLAWSYPAPYASGIDRVGKDFSGYVAFAKGVQVQD